jgi:GNAT superfamily N-acetyltransferase
VIVELLHDGSIVVLRHIRPSDAGALVRFHSTLSAETTYRRFFSFHPQLSEREVDVFTHVDHRDREAVVATSGMHIIGVGRFDRVGRTTQAEVAFVVSDQWQGRGLGGVLLASLVERARAVGIREFVAETLLGNAPMLHVFRHCGLPVTVRYDEVAHVHIDLDPDHTHHERVVQ